MTKKLRLLMFAACDRDCIGCCNKDWDLDKLPVIRDFTGYDKILLTGGEPMLHPGLIMSVVSFIEEITDTPIYLYTAKVDDLPIALVMLTHMKGMTVTLHEQKDVIPFRTFMHAVFNRGIVGKSLRVNIFKGVCAGEIRDEWMVKADIEWIKDCPLPEGEVFQRLF